MSDIFKILILSTPMILVVGISMFAVGFMEVRARRRAERQRDELNAVLSSMAEGLLIFDRDGRVLRANQRSGVLLRQSPRELIGKHIPEFDDHIKRVIKNHDIISLEINLRPSGGRAIRTRIHAAPFTVRRRLCGAIVTLEG